MDEDISFIRHHWQTFPEKLRAQRLQRRCRELAEAAAAPRAKPGLGERPDGASAALELHALDMAFGTGGWALELQHAAVEFETHDEDSGTWLVGVSIVARLKPSDGGTHHHDDVAFAWSRRRNLQQARDEALRFAGLKAHKRLCAYLYGVLPRELVDRARSSRL
jgi:hypothetical protein